MTLELCKLYELKAPVMVSYLDALILFSKNVYLIFTHEGDQNKALLNAYTYSQDMYNRMPMFYCS